VTISGEHATAGLNIVLASNRTQSVTSAARHDSAKLIFNTSGHDLYYDNDGGASSSGRILLAHLDQAGMMEATSIKLMAGERDARSHCSIANAFRIAGTTREAGPCRPLPIPV
jgi:hypothetical protein